MTAKAHTPNPNGKGYVVGLVQPSPPPPPKHEGDLVSEGAARVIREIHRLVESGYMGRIDLEKLCARKAQ